MKLDYQIFNIINNYHDENGCAKYDYVRSEIWVNTWDLCCLLREELNIKINPETRFKTCWIVAHKAWEILKGRDLIGTYGDEYLNKW